MELDLQSAPCAQLYICLRPRNPSPPLPPHLGSYSRALLVSLDRRHLFVPPLVSTKKFCSHFPLKHKYEQVQADDKMQMVWLMILYSILTTMNCNLCLFCSVVIRSVSSFAKFNGLNLYIETRVRQFRLNFFGTKRNAKRFHFPPLRTKTNKFNLINLHNFFFGSKRNAKRSPFPHLERERIRTAHPNRNLTDVLGKDWIFKSIWQKNVFVFIQ